VRRHGRLPKRNKVKLFEMKPKKFSPAHHMETFAELVCSNSLRSNQLENAVGLLKEEMRLLNSIIMKCADAAQVPAGGALAVDRTKFSQMVTELIKQNENIEVIMKSTGAAEGRNYNCCHRASYIRGSVKTFGGFCR